MKKKPKAESGQSDAFIEAARELGCDDDPVHFDEMLKKVAKHKESSSIPRPNPDKPNQEDKTDER